MTQRTLDVDSVAAGFWFGIRFLQHVEYTRYGYNKFVPLFDVLPPLSEVANGGEVLTEPDSEADIVVDQRMPHLKDKKELVSKILRQLRANDKEIARLLAEKHNLPLDS
jgi:hypothetical protein